MIVDGWTTSPRRASTSSPGIYVDRALAPASNTDFRIWVGKRGALRPAKVDDLASDAAGDVFITGVGVLRLTKGNGRVLSGTSSPRARAKERIPLINVTADNALIYGDLGVYTGVRSGTPCDDR